MKSQLNFLIPINSFILINSTRTYADLLKVVNSNKSSEIIFGFYFLYNDSLGSVSSLITDGDLRRGLSKGLLLEDQLKEFVHQDFF